jgi:hypothetical protein
MTFATKSAHHVIPLRDTEFGRYRSMADIGIKPN